MRDNILGIPGKEITGEYFKLLYLNYHIHVINHVRLPFSWIRITVKIAADADIPKVLLVTPKLRKDLITRGKDGAGFHHLKSKTVKLLKL